MFLSCFVRLLTIFIICISSNVSIAADSEIIHEKTYVIKSKSNETGYVHINQRKKLYENSIPVIVTKEHIEQNFKRNADVVKIIQDNTFVENENGKPLKFSFISKNRGEITKIRGDFNWESGQIIINTKVNDVNDSKIVKINKNILFPYARDRLYKKSKDKKLKYSIIEPGIDFRIINVKAEKIGEDILKTGKLNGVYVKYKKELNIFPGTYIEAWVDENGHIVKEYTSIFETEKFEVDKDKILNISPEFDVFSESLIKVEKTISTPELLNKALYKIQIENAPVKNTFIEDKNQRIIQIKNNTVFLEVEAEEQLDYKYPYPVKTEGHEEFLKSGPFIMPDSIVIQELAEKISAGEDDAYKIAKKMKNWVYDNITEKNFAFDFSNAVKTLENKSGDCTEHSILLISLLRAAGIPAKAIVGLVYTDQPENAFVYHMWVKAFAGKWINLDPSYPYDKFTPLHIAMSESSLNNLSAKSDIVLDIIKSFSKIDIEILNVSKPVITGIKGKPEVNVNLGNKDFSAGNNLVKLKIDKISASRGAIKEIQFPEEEDVDYIKESFYSFTRGETDKALKDLKKFYQNIDSDDDFLKMKLALKLINMTYFNFAREALEDIKNTEIWGAYINELNYIYFPRQFFRDEEEKILYNAHYALNYKNDPDFTLELTRNIQNYDYIYYLRSKAFIKKNKLKEAEKEINLALGIHSENLTYNLTKIKILSGLNKITDAQKWINRVNLITKRQKIKDKEFWKEFKSYDYWLKVKQFRENYALSKYYEAYYYLVQKDINSAISILNKLAGREKEPYIYELLADAYYEIDQLQFAKKYYLKTLSLEENSAKSNLGLGNIQFLYENLDSAESYYNRVLEINPENKEALIAMAKLYLYQDKETMAFEYFKKVLLKDKENNDVIYNLGILLANREKYKEAEKMFKKVLSNEPMKHPQVWLDLAKTQLAQGYHLKAVKSLRNVNYLDEKNAFYYYFMGLILKERGNTEKAKKYLKKALDLDPELIEKI